MKTLGFQDDILSIPIDNFRDHYVLAFNLISMQDAYENCHYPGLVEEPLRLELNFTLPLKHVTELIVLEERFQLTGLLLLDLNGECVSAANNQMYTATKVSLPWLISL